jgi:hypothetical protein
VLVLTAQGELAFAGPTSVCIEYFETVLETYCGKEKEWSRPGGMSSSEFILMAVSSLKDHDAGKLFAASRDGADWEKQVRFDCTFGFM